MHTPDPDTSRKDELRLKLGDRGWHVAVVERGILAWWADEQWTIESAFFPVGLRLVLTFLIDPQWTGNRKPGQGVWALAAAREPPATRGEAESGPCLTMKSWSRNLASFLADLGGLRNG